MGLFQKAVETYNRMEGLAGAESEERRAVLAPVGFITTGVKIAITLTENGEFVKAEHIADTFTDNKGKTQKREKKIIIPATEKSAGRTSSSAKFTPHPLCDKLMFICPEYKESYAAYLSQLEEWCNSEYACSEIKAILEYVKKGTVRADVASAYGKKAVKDTDFVCWRVLSDNCDEPEEVWKNQTVINSYINYCQSKADASSEKALCYVSGEFVTSAQQHLKGVVSYLPSAKLISANDKENFTYRGRFTDDAEALTMGFISSQKAHNALKWIISNDGFSFGSRLIVCWNPKGKKTLNPTVSLFPKFSGTEENPTPTNYRDILAKTVLGYKKELDLTDETVTAIFDASRPNSGRLAVCYYSEMAAYDFLERLRFWDETAAWIHPVYGVTSPALKNIVDAAYGVLRKENEMQKTETDEKVLSEAMQRLLLCRLERSPFPADIMRCAVQKCSSLQLYDNDGKSKNRNEQLFTTCAIIKKYRYDRFKEEWIMALEPEKKNRSYQFGRLLAVLEKAERDAFDSDEKREPNAMRMQTLFVKRPMYAAKLIIEQLKNAYYPRLKPGARNYYDRLIGEIMLVISGCPEGETGKPLGEEYLMGYYLQKNALYTKKNNDNNESEEKES